MLSFSCASRRTLRPMALKERNSSGVSCSGGAGGFLGPGARLGAACRFEVGLGTRAGRQTVCRAICALSASETIKPSWPFARSRGSKVQGSAEWPASFTLTIWPFRLPLASPNHCPKRRLSAAGSADCNSSKLNLNWERAAAFIQVTAHRVLSQIKAARGENSKSAKRL